MQPESLNKKIMAATRTKFSLENQGDTVRKVVEIADTPIQAANGRPLIRRVEKILMPNGRYRYPVTYIDMTPGYVRASEVWANKKRAPGYQLTIEP